MRIRNAEADFAIARETSSALARRTLIDIFYRLAICLTKTSSATTLGGGSSNGLMRSNIENNTDDCD